MRVTKSETEKIIAKLKEFQIKIISDVEEIRDQCY